jgi:hypothetical protein
MPRVSLPLLVVLAAALSASGAGCATRGATRLLEQAHVAFESEDVYGTYALAREIRARYPESPESREAFPLATRTYRWIWWKHRIEGTLDSEWVRTETPLLFEWTASAFGETFPKEEMRLVFRGMPLFFFKQFLAWSEGHPELSRWEMVWDEDNGRMTTLTGHRRDVPVAGAPSSDAAATEAPGAAPAGAAAR